MTKERRAQIYLATHKNQDGVYVNEAAKEICEKIELALSQSTIDESQISRNDAVGKVLGEEHSGRVRCLGLGPVPSKVFKQARPRFSGTSASRSEGSCSSQCQQNHKKMINAQEKMMNAFVIYDNEKKGDFGFFVSMKSAPSDAASGSLSPMDARRSCGDSNPSDNR
ncbi:uncharacterized protein LOC132066219 [Lycium ferocissimum]|uniref:uncharacterized protein LOC132066219 n=1 Tax=Lycium ferocissimum TaxID=112874 RepID=UPI002815B571|nr:uncharacterized protein LOC132066219 [Lycium ferocissimum]